MVWFGEALEDEVLAKTEEALSSCDMCLLVSFLITERLLRTCQKFDLGSTQFERCILKGGGGVVSAHFEQFVPLQILHKTEKVWLQAHNKSMRCTETLCGNTDGYDSEE